MPLTLQKRPHHGGKLPCTKSRVGQQRTICFDVILPAQEPMRSRRPDPGRRFSFSGQFFKFVYLFCLLWPNTQNSIPPNSYQNKIKETQSLSFKPQMLVGVRGFEPRASWSRTKRATICATPRQIFCCSGQLLYYNHSKPECQEKYNDRDISFPGGIYRPGKA